MSCAECIAATQQPHWIFRSGCRGCQARAIARGPDFYRCRTNGRQDREYRELLARVGVSHEEVCAAAEVDMERATA